MYQLNWNFVCFLFSKYNIYRIKIIKFWQLILTISKFNKTQSQCPLKMVDGEQVNLNFNIFKAKLFE